MKGSEAFENTIQDYLNERAKTDVLFAETLKKPNKNIKDCIQYIFNEVQKSGCNGFADEEVYNMAVHYYDEDKIDVGKPVSSKVIVNHSLPPDPKPIESINPPIARATEPQKLSPKRKSSIIPSTQRSLF